MSVPTVVGAILLGLGDDVAFSTSSGSFKIDGGEGNDSIFMDSNYSGDDNLKVVPATTTSMAVPATTRSTAATATTR